jgi:hypothetical protein
MKKNCIAKKQEVRRIRKCRKQDKLLVWQKNLFRPRIRPYFRTRAGYGLAGMSRRIQIKKACKMMQPVWDREVLEYDNSWEWRI